ncbi:MAG: ArnT family glycosyltransferase [Planctomycetales bacterium]
MPGSAPTASSDSSGRWWRVAAALWLALFAVAFFSVELANNKPSQRVELWPQVAALIDLVDSPPLGPQDPPSVAQLRQQSGWGNFPQRLDLIAVASTILAGAWGIGRLILRPLRLPLATHGLERNLLALGAGLSCLSLLTLGCGVAGWLSRPWLGILIGSAVAVEIVLLVRGRSTSPNVADSTVGPRQGSKVSPAPVDSPPPRSAWWTAAVWLVLTPFLVSMFLGSLLPSVDYDVNAYHFLGPKEYFLNGRITFLPHNVYTSFPFGTEMLTLLGMVFCDDWYRGALAGKCVLMAFEPLTGLVLFVAGRRWFGTAAGALAALIYLTTPWTYRIATIAYAEGGLSFYLAAALWVLSLAREQIVQGGDGREPTGDGRSASGLNPRSAASQSAPSTDPTAWYLLAGFLAGSGMACKYPGVVSIVMPLGAVATWDAIRRRTLRWPAALAIGVLLAVGPWLVKNWIETGNPVYPLMYTLFGGSDWNDALNAKWRSAHQASDFSPFSFVSLMLDIALRSDWMSPLLFAFAPLALVAARSRRQALWLAGFVGYYVLTCWLLTHRIDRFWVPMLPAVALMAGVGAAWSISGGNRPAAFGLRYITLALLAAASLFNLAVDLSPLGGYNAFLLDLPAARQFTAGLTAPEVVYLNEHLPPGSRVLAVGDAELFEARFPVVYNTVFDQSIFESLCADPNSNLPLSDRPLRDAADIRRALADQGLTHIYVNWLEILRYRSPGNYGYSDFVAPRRFQDLQRAGILQPAWMIPEAVQWVERLDEGSQKELHRFGPELIQPREEGSAFATFQVFPIAGSSEN